MYMYKESGNKNKRVQAEIADKINTAKSMLTICQQLELEQFYTDWQRRNAGKRGHVASSEQSDEGII